MVLAVSASLSRPFGLHVEDLTSFLSTRFYLVCDDVQTYQVSVLTKLETSMITNCSRCTKIIATGHFYFISSVGILLLLLLLLESLT